MRINTQKMVILSMLSAMAFMVMLVTRFTPVPALFFLNYDAKDVVIVIGGFLYGPLAALLMSVVVALAELAAGSIGGFFGLIMNIASSASLACTAALIYKHKRSLSGAINGLLAGCIMVTAVMLFWNWLILPLYLSRDVIIMIAQRLELLNGNAEGMNDRAVAALMLLPVFGPFNLLKSSFNAVLVMLLYKPVTQTLYKAGFIKEAAETRRTAATRKRSVVIAAVSVLAIAVIAAIVYFWGGSFPTPGN
jgi:riboflavin transporter FmnP